MKAKFTIWLLIISILFIGACGTTTSNQEQTQQTAQAQPQEIQQVATQNNQNIIISYKGTVMRSIPSSIGDFTFPNAGKVFLEVDMNIKNNGYDKFNTNPFNFHLILNNIKYDYDASTYELTNKLDSVDILDKGSVSGALLFQVPESTPANAQFSMNYDGFCNGFQTCNIIWS